VSKYDRFIKIYNKRGDDYCTPLDLTIPYIKEQLTEEPGSILDLGCGSGKVLWQITDLRPSRIVGVDIAEKRVKSARSKFPDGEFHCAEIYEFLQGCTDTFDVVFLFEVLEHVYDDVEIMDLISKVCPNGTLLGSVPIGMGDEECHVRSFATAKEIASKYHLGNFEERTIRGSQRVVFRKDFKQDRVTIYNPSLTEIQGAEIGDGTRVGTFTLIHKGAVIGKNCTIGSHCNICSDVVIGDNVSIQTGCHITRGVKIGDNSFIGPGVITMNDKYMDHLGGDTELNPPEIGSSTRVGGGSNLLPGVKIGDNVVVGSGSTVTKDIPDNTVAYGNPAKCQSQS
jgi:acetyltransferase-like isoleucine patch superfamily enzyme